MRDNEILILRVNSRSSEKLSNSGSVSKIGMTYLACVLGCERREKEKKKKNTDEPHFVTEYQEEWSCPFLFWKVYRRTCVCLTGSLECLLNNKTDILLSNQAYLVDPAYKGQLSTYLTCSI